MFDIRKIQEQIIYDAVKSASNDELAQKIVYGNGGEARGEDDPTWVKATMKRLENQFEKLEIKKIRRSCQCGHAMDEKLELIESLMASSKNLEEFGNLEKARAAGLSYKDGELYLEFPFCPCPMLEKVELLETDTWCQCTTGYSKVLFEKAFKCEVSVELLQSIKMGHNRCLMKIIPHEPIWNR